MRDLTYLNNVANDMLNRFDIWETIDRKPIEAEELAELCGGMVSNELRKRAVAKLAELAVCGRAFGDESEVKEEGQKPRTSMAEVHSCQDRLDHNAGGYGLLLRIATTAVLAAMTDVIKKRFPTGMWIDDHPTPQRRGTPVPHASRYARS